MKANTRRKLVWLAILSGTLCQTATTGCPDGTQIRGVFGNSLQAFINGVVALYVKAGVNEVLDL